MKRKLDIENELSAISQTVDNLPVENPFSVPADYFETFSERIRELTTPSSSPLLQSIPKENPFVLPEGYFQEFMVSKQKVKTIKFFPARTMIRYAAAACITGLVVTLFFISEKSGNEEFTAETKAIPQAEISNDAVETYLSDADNLGLENNSDELAEAVDNALVDLSSETVGQLLSELSENGLAQYMNLNEINENRTLFNL